MRSIAIIGLIIVTLLSLAFAGYTVLNQHAAIVTQQQLVTNTQNIYTTQTQTVTSQTTATSLTTITNTNGNGYGNYQVCGYYGCYYYPGSGYYNYPSNQGYYYYNNGYYPGNVYYSNYPMYYYGYYNGNYLPPCQRTGSSYNVTCSGYIYQAGNGCTVLSIPTVSNPYPSYATGDVLEYYTLHNLPANAPSTGTWVTVTGQLYNGPNSSSNGQSCPDNYIVVSSIN